MKRLLIVFLALGSLFAQQQVVPKEFDAGQAKLFKKLTEAISTPCCNNGIPVAYHDSGMAQYVRGIVIDAIKQGQKEDQIMATLVDLKLGPNKDMPLIFTVPEKNLVGKLFWAAPVGALLLGLLVIYFLLRVSGRHQDSEETDDELLERYSGFIQNRVENLEATE